MREQGSDTGNSTSGRSLGRIRAIMEGVRNKVGASPRQFLIFSLLLVVAATLWARPAGLLLWHRLRIITGMPRMAVANEDPELLAREDATPPESLDAGTSVRLDETLRRDPFRAVVAAASEGNGDSNTENSTGATLDMHLEDLRSRVAQIQLTGTAKGLGTAVLDGRARGLGRTFEAHGAQFRLTEVRSAAVVLEVWMAGEQQRESFFLLDRSGATALQNP